MRLMMKFCLRSVKNGCRVGLVSELPFDGRENVETPALMLYTKAGSVPYISRDVLDRIDGHPGITSFPLALLAEHHEAIASFQKGIKKFTVLDDCVGFCPLQDSASANPSGYNDKNATAVWGRGGKFTLDVSTYMQVIEALQPDWCQCLCDSDTSGASSRKRVRKSVDRSLDFLDRVIELKEKSERLKTTQMFGVINGGRFMDERLRSARETSERSVNGFVVEGFHNFGTENRGFQITSVSDLLQKTLALLPPDKPRILPGIQDPENVLNAITLGFDFFDASYPYVVTESGSALVFTYSGQNKNKEETSQETTETSTQQQTWAISLQDKCYREDLTPLVASCECYTCRNHTKAYINHLLNVSEILARVLLMVHNLHHYLRFFETVRQSLHDDTFDLLKEEISRQKPT